MIIGVPREIKEHEYRVAVTPSGVQALVKAGHAVLVEDSAGIGSGFSNPKYANSGASITDKNRLFKESELIVKVKEPLADEYPFFREGQAVFTYLHLAPNPELKNFLIEKQITAFAYETLLEDGTLPLLMPMSEIAGKMAPVMAAYYLQKVHGGSGTLFTGVHGAPSAHLLIIGAGVAGMNALTVAYGMGTEISVINRGADKLRLIEERYKGRVKTAVSSPDAIEREAIKSDAVICAVLIAGARTPKLITRELVAKMKKGSVIVDISVDQGGCSETTIPTTHTDPVYTVDGVVHYAVPNMPGAYPRTSTLALTCQTIRYIGTLADTGIEKAIRKNPALRSALNAYQGVIVHNAINGTG